MKIVKGIAVYTLIILGAILLLGLILLGLMFIFPKFSLFGYNFQYKSYKGTTFDSANFSALFNEENSKPVVNLYVNNGDYNLNLDLHNNSAELTSGVVNNYFGFVKTEKGAFETSISTTSTLDKEILTFHLTLNQPEGAVAFKDENTFNVSLPKQVYGKDITYNLYINGDNGDVNLDGYYNKEGTYAGKLNINNLSITTKRGNINLKGLADTAEKNGTVVEGDSVTLTNLNIYTEGGKVSFENYQIVNITNKLILNSTRADYIFKTLKANKGIEVIGTNVGFQADVLEVLDEAGFVYKAGTGSVKIGKINTSNETIVKDNENPIYYESTIITESAKVEIDDLTGIFGIKNEYGDVIIKNTKNTGTIKNIHGDINISKAEGSLILSNDFGNITVSEYYETGVFATNSGDVNVVSKNISGDKKESTCYTQITTENGNIYAQSESKSVFATSTGKGNVTVVISNISSVDNRYKQTFGGKSNVSYGVSVNSGDMHVLLPAAGTISYDVYAKGNVSGSITSSAEAQIQSDKNAHIMHDSDKCEENFPLVVLLGGDIKVEGKIS